MTRNSTLWALNSNNRSLKSEVIGALALPGQTGFGQLSDRRDTLGGCRARPIPSSRFLFSRTHDATRHYALVIFVHFNLFYGFGSMEDFCLSQSEILSSAAGAKVSLIEAYSCGMPDRLV